MHTGNDDFVAPCPIHEAAQEAVRLTITSESTPHHLPRSHDHAGVGPLVHRQLMTQLLGGRGVQRKATVRCRDESFRHQRQRDLHPFAPVGQPELEMPPLEIGDGAQFADRVAVEPATSGAPQRDVAGRHGQDDHENEHDDS